MRDLVIASALIGAVALGATSAPVDDSAQTKADRDVSILVLLNDPAESELLSVGSPSSGVGTAVIDPSNPDQVIYTPNGFTGNETFTYTTDGGSATVTVAVTAGTVTTGGSTADFISTEINTPIRIRVLDNDDPGTKLLGVNNPPPPLPIVTRGTVEIEGNEILYTPLTDFEGADRFFYQTQYGSELVTVSVVQSVSDQPVLATVFLRNTTQFQAQVRITSAPGVFLDCADPTQAFGFANLGPTVNMEPFSEIQLCVEIPNSTIPQSVTFIGEEVGVSDPRSTQNLSCVVSATQDIAVTFNEDRQFDAQGFLIVDRVFLTCQDVP